MLRCVRLCLLVLITFALVSGAFQFGTPPCSCSREAAFAQGTADSPADPADAATPEGAGTGPAAAAVASAPLPTTATSPAITPGPSKPLPRMIDLGAGKCLACQKMKPVLEEATARFAGKAEIVFIDVWTDRAAGSQYGIRMIPTQIFFDADGKEVFRHEGFLSLDDITAQFEKMGVVVEQE